MNTIKISILGIFYVALLSACGGGDSAPTDCAAGLYGPNCTCTAGPVVTVDFRKMGTTQVPSLVVGDVSVIGSADIYLLDSNGLGIVGGASSTTLDGVESVTFAFAAPAVDVSYLVSVAGNSNGNGLAGEAFLDVFDTTPTSLGSFPVSGAGVFNIADFVGGKTPISSFTVTANVDSLRIGFLNYSLLVCP